MQKNSTYIATPPGATIKEQLDDRGMSQKEFAARMDMSEKHISRLINGVVQLTPDMSVRLETVLGVPAEFWNRLEAIYREKIAREKVEEAMDADIELAEAVPYNEMAQMGWIRETRKPAERAARLRKYFEVVSLHLLENRQITKIACRGLDVTEKSDAALIAWAQKAKLAARDMITSPIDRKGLILRIPEIRKMTNQPPEIFCDKLKQLLADCGTALVFLPHLKGSLVQGATFADGRRIVLVLTAGEKDADQFWFSFFHELAHIVLGHIDQENGTDEADEKNADKWAAEVLIPEDDYTQWINSGSSSIDEIEICAFAEKTGVAPGIVVGRLQNEGILNKNMFNSLKEQYVIPE